MALPSSLPHVEVRSARPAARELSDPMSFTAAELARRAASDALAAPTGALGTPSPADTPGNGATASGAPAPFGFKGAQQGGGPDASHPTARRVEDGSLVLKVPVEVDGRLVHIAVGSGRQTIRWLATAAQQRALATRGNSPRLARYEMKHRPAVVTTVRGEMVNPNARVKDVVAFEPDGLLRVTLQTGRKPRLTTEGAVTQGLWEAEAFNKSHMARKRTTKIQDEARLKWEADRQEARQKEMQRTAKRLDQLEKLLVSDLSNAAAMERAMEADWTFVRIRKLTTDEAEINHVKTLLLKHYVGISELYKVFAGASDLGSSSELSLTEFTRLMCSLPGGVFTFANDAKVIERVFRVSNVERCRDTKEESLTRFEFVEALLLLAVVRFGAAAPFGISVRKRKGSEVKRSVPEALEVLLSGYLMPALRNMGAGASREALMSEEVRYMLSTLLPKLRRVFTAYSKKADGGDGDPDRSDVRNGTMRLPEFLQLLRDAKMLNRRSAGGADRDKHELLASEARRAFSGSQLEEDQGIRAMAKRQTEDDIGDTASTLVLSEWLDALARCALMKWDDEPADVTDAEKVCRIMNAVAKIDVSLRAK